jgi:tetratricopeptide (TPR) repeat protein
LSNTGAPYAAEADPLFVRAGELQRAGDFEAAAEAYARVAERAVTLNIAANLAVCLTETARFAEAERWLRLALENRPNLPELHRLIGNLHQEQGRVDLAERDYRAGLALKPDDDGLRLALGGLLLSLGRFAEGWPLMEARIALHPSVVPPIQVSFPEWLGEPLAGRSILVWYEQGLGDQIQFARFAPALQAMGAEVTLVAPPELAALFAGLGVTVVEQGAPPAALPSPDHWTLPLSIPGRLGTTLATLPQPPYLAAPPDRRAGWAGHAPKGTVGVAWRGRSTHGNDAHRSLASLETLAPLAAAGATLLDLSDPVGDFADLAAVVEGLDLVVSVDTALAHLAGALGKPCWVLLPWFRTDWRWLAEGEASPWYPSIRLFRQPALGDWASPIAALADAYAAQFGS